MNAAAAPADPLLFTGRDAPPTKGIGLAWPRVGVVPLIPPVADGITPEPVAVGRNPVTNPVPLMRPVPEGRTPVPVGRGKPAVPWGRRPVGITKPPVGNTKLPRTGVDCGLSGPSSTMLAKFSPMLRR